MEFHMDVTHLITGTVLLIAWLVRLEFTTIQNKKDIDELTRKHDALDEKIFDKLSKIETKLGNIEGKISVLTKE